MATMITSECINCGACEPECPNTAIYQGGVAWEFNGATNPALSQDTFYIVPEKCTECVGFHDQEACAAVCPVDCCVPDPKWPESEDVLMQRARQLHPGTEFPADFPSRFKGEGGGAAPAAAPAAAAVATAAAPATVAAAPAAAAPAIGVRVEKPFASPKAPPAPPKPWKLKDFSQELPGTFDDALLAISGGGPRGSAVGGAMKFLTFVTAPLLGALPVSQKRVIEKAVGDPRVFSASGATGLNVIHNMILYPVLFGAFGVVAQGKNPYSVDLKSLLFYGAAAAAVETIWRVREGFRAQPLDEIPPRAAVYGVPLSIATLPLITLLKRADPDAHGSVAVDGFHGGTFEEKTERERRYGEVYTLKEEANGFYVRFEFARKVPSSAIKDQLGVADEMPEYDYDLSLDGNALVVKGSVRDANVRRVAAVSPAFPPDFTTRIELAAPVAGFKHRIEDRVLEVVLPKR